MAWASGMVRLLRERAPRIGVFICLFAATAAAKPVVTARGSESRYWRCDVQQKWECQLPGGCRKLDVTPSWVLLDFLQLTYQRCDGTGCDKYTMVAHERTVGAFITTYVTLPNHPDVFFKIAAFGHFVDVASLGPSATTSMGSCRALK